MIESASQWLELSLAICSAAAIQTITGMGFALISGPVILITLNDHSAVAVGLVLNLLTALCSASTVRRGRDSRLLLRLTLGSVFGIPLGLVLFGYVSVAVLKVLCGAAISFVLLLSLFVDGNAPARSMPPSLDMAVGTISGLMNSLMAMPGPVPATYLASVRRDERQVIRSTLLSFFVISYVCTFASHALAGEIHGNAIIAGLKLFPASVLGIALGHVLAPHVSETCFRRIVLLALAATTTMLLVSAV